MSQRVLGLAAGTSRGAISAIESGLTSPTVQRLDRLLAACGLQLRVSLEPLQAPLDALVDAMEAADAAAPQLAGDQWRRLADSLGDVPGDTGPSLIRTAPRRGPVRWAVDGASALVLHGLTVPLDAMDVVVELDDALRYWMKAVQLRGLDAREHLVMDWYDADLLRMTEALHGARFCLLGFVRVRVVEHLPPTMSLVLPWLDRGVRVVSVEEVEGSHPAYAEVLARRRTRRNLGA